MIRFFACLSMVGGIVVTMLILSPRSQYLGSRDSALIAATIFVALIPTIPLMFILYTMVEPVRQAKSSSETGAKEETKSSS